MVNYGKELFRRHQASIGVFQAILEQFGKRGAVELTLIFGNYNMLALSINAFDSDLPPNRTELLLPSFYYPSRVWIIVGKADCKSGRGVYSYQL